MKFRCLFDKYSRKALFFAAFFTIMLAQLMSAFFSVRSTGLCVTEGFSVSKLLFIGGALALVCLAVAYYFVVLKNFKAETVYFIMLIAFAVGYMLVFPPITVPDELVHYRTAYRISNYLLLHFKQLSTAETIIRAEDAVMFNDNNSLVNADNYRFIADNFSLFVKSGELALGEAQNISYIFAYFFSSLGVAFARILHLGAVPTFYMGRMFNIIAYALITRYVIKSTQSGKMAVFAISFLPMVLHEVASYSYDAATIAFGMLFVTQVMRIRQTSGAAKTKDLILCGIYGILLAPSKVVYFPLLAMAFLIPNDKISSRRVIAALVKCAVALAGVAALGLFQLSSSKVVAPGLTSNVEWAGGVEGYTVGWVLTHIPETVLIYLRTISNRGYFYVQTLVGGSLGWFQISLPTVTYMSFYFLLFLSAIKRKDENIPFGFCENIFIFALCLVVAGFVLASMLLAWTPVTYDFIEGVQGRYFMPIVLPLLLMLKNEVIQIDKRADKYIMFAFFTMNYVVLCETLQIGLG